MKINKDKNIALIRGDPKKAIRKLSIPIIFSMLIIVLYNIVDSFWVAGLGTDALAAIGFISPLFTIIVGIGSGIGSGTNSLIARYIGADNKEQANNAGLHGVIIAIIISVIITVIIHLSLTTTIHLSLNTTNTMTTIDNINSYITSYGTIIFGGLIVFVLSGVESAIFRSEGDMKRATYAIVVTAILNIILDPIFIYYFNLGIEGAAWATVISATISCLIMAYWIWIKQDLYLDYNFKKYFKLDKKIIITIIKVACPSIFETVLLAVVTVITNIIIMIVIGSDAVAIYATSWRIIQITTIPTAGIASTVITVTGIAYGANNYKNLKLGHSYSIKLGFIVSVILGVIMIIFSNNIAQSFVYTADPLLVKELAESIRILSLINLAIPLGIMSSMLFQGVGKGINALIITILRSLIFELLFVYLFGIVLDYGEFGIYLGVIVGCFLGGLVGYIWAKIFIKKYTNKIISEYEKNNNIKEIEV